jgi:branched-chain amino acid transport system permease protein
VTPLLLREHGPGHRAAVGACGALVALTAVAVPVVFGEPTVILFSQAVAAAVAILGLNIVMGFTGQVSLGHSAFMGIGAYTTAILVVDHDWSFFATIPVAAVLCFAVGMLVGIPALRIKGIYLALATLGLAVVFPSVVNKWSGITGGPSGKRLGRKRLLAPEWTGLEAREDAYVFVYASIVVIAAVLFLLARNMVRSRAGRALMALRDDPIGAEASGVDIARFKVLAFGISALYAGIAGSLLMFTQRVATGTNFSLGRSIELVTGVVIGGLASLPGSLVGGLVVVFLPDWAKNVANGTLRDAIYGVLLIAIIALHPGGVANLVRLARSRLVRVVPGHPPSPASPLDRAPAVPNDA